MGNNVKENNSSTSKTEVSEEVFGGNETMKRNCKRDIIKFKEANNAIAEYSCQKELKAIYKKMPQEVEEDAPKMEDKYSYKWSKWGFVDEKIAQDINKRYKEGKTILHNVAMDTQRKDYVKAVVALIKMGANTTLRDNARKTPIDYIPNDRINEVYQNLKTTLKRYQGKAVGLRVLRAMVEIEESKPIDNKESNKEIYFKELEAFVKSNYQKKTKEDMENILSIHVSDDDNIGLRAQKEEYFIDKMESNTNDIECAQGFFKTNKLDFEGLTDKNTNFESSVEVINKLYNKYLLNFNNGYEENKIIRNYILEDSSVKVRELKQDIMDSLKILSFIKDGVLRNGLETDIERIIEQHPTLVNAILSNEKDVIEKIKDNLKVSAEDEIKPDINLEGRIEKTIRDIKKYINEKHFKQIMLKITNIYQKGSDKDVQDFLKDYKEYLLENQPRSVKQSIYKRVKKADILEIVINVNSKRLLETLVKNGRDINRCMINGKLPIELAIDNNNEAMVETLLNLGAQVDLVTKNNVTVLDLLKEKMPSMCEIAKSIEDKKKAVQLVKTSNTQEKSVENDKEVSNNVTGKGALNSWKHVGKVFLKFATFVLTAVAGVYLYKNVKNMPEGTKDKVLKLGKKAIDAIRGSKNTKTVENAKEVLQCINNTKTLNNDISLNI